MDIKKTETRSIRFATTSKDILEFQAECEGDTAVILQVTSTDENGDSTIRIDAASARDLQRWLGNVFPPPTPPPIGPLTR